MVRHSLRGEAGQIEIHMEARATLTDIFDKLEGLYGTVESGAVLLQQLYGAKQGPLESIASYSARLLLAIHKAKQRGDISPTAREETLRVVFWKGLTNDKVKHAIRHKYETLLDSDDLVKAGRTAEQEAEDKFHSSPTPTPKSRPSSNQLRAQAYRVPQKK